MLNVAVILGKSEIAENFWYPSFNLPALLADRLEAGRYHVNKNTA